MDRGISSYSIFIPTSTGMKVECVDIHDSTNEEEDIKTDLEKVKEILTKKYKMKISLVELKPDYHTIY
jgi:hypothetical protein